MGSRSEALARECESANASIIEALRGTSHEDWHKVCDGEGWPVGVVFHHLASSYPATVAVARAAASGAAPQATAELLNQQNARHAREHAECTPEDTFDLLQESGEAAAAAIRAFTDEELNADALLPLFGDELVEVEAILRFGQTCHIEEHMASIRKAISR